MASEHKEVEEEIDTVAVELQEMFENGEEVEESNAAMAKETFERILSDDRESEGAIAVKEKALLRLGVLHARQKNASELAGLLRKYGAVFGSGPKGSKAKVAKVARLLIDAVADVPDSQDAQIALCEESVAWCRSERRTFLRLRIQNRLASLMLGNGAYLDALNLLQGLLREVKKLDDKPLLVEVHLIESRVHYKLHNQPKARAALTAARAAANAIYVGPETQAEIDVQAGTLCAEDKDYKTAFSYFFEAFEAYHSLGRRDDAIRSLKHMLLARIMAGQASEALAVINGKHGVSYASKDLESMRAVAQAHKDRSLEAFERVLVDFEEQLQGDDIVQAHVGALRDDMVEQHIQRVIEPFSRVEIDHVAHLVGLPVPRVEAKLSQMILDSKINGTLDQGRGELVVYPEPHSLQAAESAIQGIEALNKVVDGLFSRAEGLV